jgi:hypothetical protein
MANMTVTDESERKCKEVVASHLKVLFGWRDSEKQQETEHSVLRPRFEPRIPDRKAGALVTTPHIQL